MSPTMPPLSPCLPPASFYISDLSLGFDEMWPNRMFAVSVELRPTIKNCWFAVLLPTRQNWPYPKNFMAILRKIFFFLFIFTKLFFPKPFLCSDNVLLYCFNFNISYFEPYTSTNIANYKDIFLVPIKKINK